MQIIELVTVQLAEFPNILFVRLHTDAGLVGLGETFFGASEVSTFLHESAAPLLLGQDASAIDALRVKLRGSLGTQGTGAGARGASAVDIALWDLLGKATDRPVFELLGGASHTAIRGYNTCAGYRYVRAARGQALENWGLPGLGRPRSGPYED